MEVKGSDGVNQFPDVLPVSAMSIVRLNKILDVSMDQEQLLDFCLGDFKLVMRTEI